MSHTKSYCVRFFWISMAMLCFFSIQACSNDGAEKAEEKAPARPSVGVLIYNSNDLYIQAVTTTIQQSIGNKAILYIETADRDQFLQNEQIDNLIAKNIDALIINLVDPITATLLSEKAEKINIPIVFFSREPDVNSLKAYKNTCFVGTIPEHAGMLQGDLIKELWDTKQYDKNNDGILQYIMIQANTGNAEAVARTEYSIKQATKHGIKLQQVGETFISEWSKDLAQQAIQQAWPIMGDNVELIIANSDAMALGAIAAIQEYGYNLGKSTPSPYVPVIGVDALAPAVEAIKQGTMAATVKQDAQLMGKTIVQLILNALAGKDFIEGTTLQWDASGKAIRIPYAPFTLKTIEQAAQQADTK